MWDQLKTAIDWIYDPNNLTAFSTLIIAAFTIILALVGYTQARLIKKSIDLARREFLATHRPRIIVRFIQGPTFTEEPREVIFVTVANTGISSGVILAFGGDLVRRKGKARLGPADSAAKPITPVRLLSGKRHTFEVQAAEPYGEAEILDDATDRTEICAFGVIRYSDEGGVVRETGFSRVYDREREAFVPSQDEGEYQD